MNNRLYELRKDLQLTQEQFAKKLNISKGHVSTMEGGKRVLTDRTITDICRIFSVNEEWLRDGKGEMYRTSIPENSLAIEIAKLISSDDDWTKNAVLQLLKLPSYERDIIKKFVTSLSSSK